MQQMGKLFGPTQAPLLVRSLAQQGLPVGSTVRLTEVAQAHVFPMQPNATQRV